MRALAPIALLALAGCNVAQQEQPAAWAPPLGSNRVLETEPGAAPGHRLVITDLNLGPDATGPAHYHPWEEFLYIIEGSAIVALEGEEPQILVPGDSFVIPPRMVHRPQAGPTGVRAIVTRLHNLADPITVPAE